MLGELFAEQHMWEGAESGKTLLDGSTERGDLRPQTAEALRGVAGKSPGLIREWEATWLHLASSVVPWCGGPPCFRHH